MRLDNVDIKQTKVKATEKKDTLPVEGRFITGLK